VSSADLRSGGDGQAQGLSEARSIGPAETAATPSPQGAYGIAGLPRAWWKREWLLGLVLIAATVVAYLPALHGGFLFDDSMYISDNQTLRPWKGFWEIWFKPGATCQYYPLTFTGFWVGYHLWGLNPLGYHLVNVLLHGVVAMLLWQVLARLKVRGAWLAGAIFALHPVNVMSVAWMTELKNTLSGSLALGAAWAYVRFARLGVYATEQGGGAVKGTVSGSDWGYYVLALALFQLALLAKTAVSFLPVTLLLAVWWQRERLCWREAWPLLAMLGMAVAMGGVTIYVERHSGGASGEQFHIPFLERVLISGRSFWFYLGKLFFPYRLTFIYERWHTDAGAWWQYVYPAATLGALGGLWGMRKRIGRGAFAAMFHFYVSTSLLILIVVPYFTLFSFVSDHWQYFGCMSVIALAAAGITRALGFFRKLKPILEPAFCGMLLLVLGVLTWGQSGLYANIETLWRTTLARNPNCWVARCNLGNVLLQNGRVDEAVTHFRKAMEIQPDDAGIHNNLGNALLRKGQVVEAIGQYEEALRLRPDFAEAHYNLGSVLLQKGRVDEAITHFQKAVEIQPDDAGIHISLGNALLQKGRVDEAITHFQKAVEIQPDDAGTHNNLGNALYQKGQVDKAVTHYRKALEIQPGYAEARNNFGNTLLQKGQLDEAIAQFQRVLEIQPGFAMAHYNLGTAFLRNGQLDGAIAHYQRALEIRPDYAEAHINLGSAHLQKGQLDEALAHFQKAIELRPELPGIYYNLGLVLLRKGRVDEAIAHFQKAIEGRPDSADARNSLAWVLATSPQASVRNGARAVELAQQAERLSEGRNPMILGTLAAAYAEAGRFTDAVATAQQALQLATAQSNAALANAFEQHIKLYRAGLPFHGTLPTNAPASGDKP
jgi:protein O-mannosyl-transferase